MKSALVADFIQSEDFVFGEIFALFCLQKIF